MARYGFLIDQDTCIGCHACTTACKSEHDVPLGVNRTWVKYIEKGTFPNVSRRFSVMRCNHCDAAPCVVICPTSALFTRTDGIVDFDTTRCIGCKACMNACPYDALYIHPQEHTAQKCNFCAHRVEAGLEPSCVVVCPTQSILAGDLDDPGSRISQVLAHNDVHVRAPEQGTRPKLFYKGADAASLDPIQTAIAADGLIWADTTPHHPTVPMRVLLTTERSPNETQGLSARTAYTTAHPAPWAWQVSAYLVTKSIGAGTLLVATLLVLLGHATSQAAVGVVPPIIAGTFIGATGALLVADLKHPERCHYILTKPNWASWLTRGAAILGVYAALAAAWLIAGTAGSAATIKVIAAPTALLALATAGYTAFLFGQCEGRDLWQTPLLLPALLAKAVTSGAAALLSADLFLHLPSAKAVRWAFLVGVLSTGAFAMLELVSRGSPHVAMAVRVMCKGALARRFWLGMVLGVVVPAALVATALAAGGGADALDGAAGASAVLGMLAYEDSFVRAGQAVPLS